MLSSTSYTILALKNTTCVYNSLFLIHWVQKYSALVEREDFRCASHQWASDSFFLLCLPALALFSFTWAVRWNIPPYLVVLIFSLGGSTPQNMCFHRILSPIWKELDLACHNSSYLCTLENLWADDFVGVLVVMGLQRSTSFYRCKDWGPEDE